MYISLRTGVGIGAGTGEAGTEQGARSEDGAWRVGGHGTVAHSRHLVNYIYIYIYIYINIYIYIYIYIYI